MATVGQVSQPAFTTYNEFVKAFNKAYQEWFQTSILNTSLRERICAYSVTMEQFDALTKNRQFQRYIALVDGRIR
jgi:hypothetical protein